MRFPWPRTLLWRTFLLIVLLLGISLAGWFQIYRQYVMEPRTRQLAQLVVSVVNLTRSALLAADADQRLALLAELNTLEGIRLYPAETNDALVALPDGATMQIVQEQVRRRLGNDTRFTGELYGQSGFYVSFQLDEMDPEDQYWIMLPSERVRRIMATRWLGWGVIAILGSLVAAWLLVLSIGRPLKALEHAARAIGRGEQVPPLSEQGPEEVATLAAAFNQMSRDLEQLDSDRALILAGVSHDLRTPLARLRLGLEMSGARAEDLAAMNGDIEEMDRTINQFLDFARDQHAEPEESVELHAMLEQIVQGYRNRNANVSLIGTGHLEIRIRPQAVRRAVINLIDNALRHGGALPAIEVSLRTAGKMASICVEDRGPGIPAEQVERLKRPFTQLGTSRSNVQGAGLGLAIVDRIARMHGGGLDLLPRPGGGLSALVRLQRKS
ncbi:ATP-binding protein [Uliginosibacterium paludis]|uniref:histidine kinase n=1 Tax=Uliginosibacterium paludis TaxID=1615952 RepID=A0ABV2CUF9_9RHOO